MKSINLLPPELIRRDELKRFAILSAVIWAVIFLCLILLVGILRLSYGTVSVDIEKYRALAADEKYVNADLLAEKARGIRADISELIGTDKIDLGIIVFIAEAVLGIQGNDQFIYLEELSYVSDRLEIIGVVSDRELISEFVHALRDEGIFIDIDIPGITQMGDINRFNLSLAVSGMKGV